MAKKNKNPPMVMGGPSEGAVAKSQTTRPEHWSVDPEGYAAWEWDVEIADRRPAGTREEYIARRAAAFRVQMGDENPPIAMGGLSGGRSDDVTGEGGEIGTP